jgi:hypothetical protein
MTVKIYPTPYSSTEEVARQQAVAERVAQEFKTEFEAMCKKYKAEFRVRDDGIDVEFDGVYEDSDTVRPCFTIQFGTSI